MSSNGPASRGRSSTETLPFMRVHLGSDHAGFELKNHLGDWLAEQQYDVVDHGPKIYQPADDYPTYCLRTALAVAGDPGSLGIVIGGSGNGEQMAANKVAGIRAALAWSDETASLARLHNDANVVSLGARMHTVDEATRFAGVFLTTGFTREERHRRRIAMIADYEETGALPASPSS
jgi:ribose 5-phosphate isomerase B